MTLVNSTRTLFTVTRWIGATIEAAQKRDEDIIPMAVLQLKTWRDAICTAATSIEERERKVVLAEARLDESAAGDRVDIAFALHYAEEGTRALHRLVTFAAAHGDRAQVKKIQNDAQILIDTLEALSRGINRPHSPKQSEPENHG